MEKIDINDIYKPLRGSTIHVGLDFLPEEVEESYNMDPDYQRGHVWEEAQRSSFVGFVLEGGQAPPIVVNNVRYEEEGVREVVDGKQRLTSLLMWMRGEIPATLSNGVKVYRKDVSGRLFQVDVLITRVNFTRKQALRYYIKTNSGGTVHSKDEIKRVQDLLEKES